MLLATLRDGRTLLWDLSNPPELRAWEASARDPAFLASVTSLALRSDAGRVDLPLPRRFRGEVRYRAEVLRDRAGAPAGERLRVEVGGVALSLLLRAGERAGRVRVDLEHRGRRRWEPSPPS